jgi:hypothetical protein
LSAFENEKLLFSLRTIEKIIVEETIKVVNAFFSTNSRDRLMQLVALDSSHLTPQDIVL